MAITFDDEQPSVKSGIVFDDVPVPKPAAPPEKPSYWQGMKNVTGQYIDTAYQPLKMGAEAALGWTEALGTGVKQAGAMIGQGAGALAEGGGMQGALEAAGQAQHEQLQQPILPEMLHRATGEPSWMAQGMGSAVNELVKRNIISEDSARNVANLLMLVGFGGAKAKFAKLTSPATPNPVVSALRAGYGAFERAPARWNEAFASPEARAGSVLNDAGKVIAENVPQRPTEQAAIATRTAQQVEAQQVLGVGRFDEGSAPNPRRRNLVSTLSKASDDVAQSEALLREGVVTKAREGLENIIPRESIDPARHNFLVRTLEADAAVARSAVDSVKAAAESSAREAVDAVNSVVPKNKMPGEVQTQVGEQVLNRLRGKEGDKPADVGIAAVRKVFDDAYKPFDEDLKGVAPSRDLAAALETAADPKTENGRVLANHLGMAKQAEKRLKGENIIDESGQDVPSMPETPQISWWRNIKGEFYTARNTAKLAGHNDAARRLGDLARMAEFGENAAAEAMGPGKAAEYGQLKEAYKVVYHRGLREGYVGKAQLPGSAWHGGGVNPATVLPAMMQFQNVDSVLRAFGAEKVVKSGKVPIGVSEADLRVAGLPAAQAVVRPYVESVLSSLYDLAGGGKKGAAKVATYLSNPQNAKTLQAYGLDFNQLRTASLAANEPMGRLTGATLAAAKGIAADVLPTTDPTLIGRKVLDAPSPVSMRKNFLGVSSDPAWAKTIDTLITKELQARVEAGENIFSEAKTSGLMSEMWSPQQIKGLRVYYETLRGLAEKTAKSDAPALPEHAMHTVSNLGQSFPVGMRMWYAGKYMARALAKMKIIKDDSVAVQWLNDAMVNPEKEKIAMDAYRGHKASGEKLKAAIAADRKIIADLKKAHGPTTATIPRVIGGAAVSGIQDFSAMDDAMLLAHP